jgi:hypothetical protein
MPDYFEDDHGIARNMSARRIIILLTLGCCLAAQLQAGTQSIRAAQPKDQVYLINDGDSLLNLNGSPSGMTSMSYAMSQIKGLVGASNTSISGETLAKMVNDFSRNVGSKYQTRYDTVIVHSLGGGNDIRLGTSVSELYSLLQKYVRSVHALGPHAFSIISTYPVQCDILKDPMQNATLHLYNDLIYQGWNKPQMSGGLGADGIVDYFNDPTIGANSYTYSAFCSARWSRDGEHLNDEGKEIMGQIESQAITRFLASR